jgi:hypothetical protein
MKLSILVPAFNERQTVTGIVRRVAYDDGFYSQ